MNIKDLVLPSSPEEFTMMKLIGEHNNHLYYLIGRWVLLNTNDRRDLIYMRQEHERIFLTWLMCNPWAVDYIERKHEHARIRLAYTGIWRNRDYEYTINRHTEVQTETLIGLKAA